MKWQLAGFFGLLLAVAFLKGHVDVKGYAKSLATRISGASTLAMAYIPDLKDSETSDSEDSEMSETEISETSETEISETSETEISETSETEISETSETEISETSEIEDLETSETEDSDALDEDGWEISHIEDSEAAAYGDSGPLDLTQKLMDSAKRKAGQRRTTGSMYCLSEDANPYTGFATMTPYRIASTPLKADDVIPRGCKPVQIWHLIRHGSHGAHRNDYIKFEDELPFLRRKIFRARAHWKGNLCDKDLKLIRLWKVSKMMSKTGTLSVEGMEEIAGLADRFKSVFPGLLEKKFSAKLHPGAGNKIAFGTGRQNQQSAVAYVSSMYGPFARFVPVGSIPSRDLQFYDYCRNYIEGVLNMHKKLKPYHNFMSGSIMNSVLRRVSERLGFPVTVANVRVMYNACRYYYAWYKNIVSPWCTVFTPMDLKVLEYWEDLRVYHDQGHRFEISSKQACVLGKDVMDQFRNRVENGSTELYAASYFVNPEALVTFITLLGLFNDEEPITEFYIPSSRLWKTSQFAGFGSNLAILLSLCADDSFWVSALLNEKPVQLPGCDSSLGCPWNNFSQYYDYLSDCNFDELCGSFSSLLTQSRHWYALYMNEQWM
ncbi:multiple inositol polyphosphate phosphatase 1-like [Penaeus monodon]|uniref:multiple inositol polyphosphate phosphatase 1-like n=1 Tax=Penaeus monodon TaxID=6687 RepID=UPI0018A74B7A|nr:multiple inositol polyphosphate phosphatase 1-like [Penaeus monodon]